MHKHNLVWYSIPGIDSGEHPARAPNFSDFIVRYEYLKLLNLFFNMYV